MKRLLLSCLPNYLIARPIFMKVLWKIFFYLALFTGIIVFLIFIYAAKKPEFFLGLVGLTVFISILPWILMTVIFAEIVGFSPSAGAQLSSFFIFISWFILAALNVIQDNFAFSVCGSLAIVSILLSRLFCWAYDSIMIDKKSRRSKPTIELTGLI